MPDSSITRNYSKQLLFCALLLLPLAYIAGSVLDSWFFHEGNLSDQIFSPGLHELAIRGVSSLFIVLIAVIAIHFIRKSTQLEKALRKRNEDLLLVNLELEAFNYSLSHDLRNSLTIIYTSMEMLRDHFQTGKDPQCHFLLSSICKYSEKMEAQLECMLLLSSSSGRGINRENVFLDELAQELIEEILPKTGQKPLVTIEVNLSAYCNRNLVHMALSNLLSNAVKFLSPEREGKIVVGKLQQDEQTVFYVRDNGIGFEPDRTEQLFETLTQLSNTPSLPGGGIGMATTRRIIERHGGRIWAEGAPDQGATFYFTLPPASCPFP